MLIKNVVIYNYICVIEFVVFYYLLILLNNNYCVVVVIVLINDEEIVFYFIVWDGLNVLLIEEWCKFIYVVLGVDVDDKWCCLWIVENDFL